MRIEDIYKDEFEIVCNLFNRDIILRKLDRLNEIYKECEDLWNAQLNFLPDRIVKYLLIAESPPWSDDNNIINYIYNVESKPRTLLIAISKAFFGNTIYKEIGINNTLEKLANGGFLIMDSIPFSLCYSSVRNRALYKELVQQTCSNYLIEKINNTQINWDTDLKVAFSLKNNAKIIINEFKDGLNIKSKNIMLNEDMIAVNNAGYPCDKKLRKIYFEIND